MEYFRYHSTNCFFIQSTTTGKLPGIELEIIITQGHSEDSISIIQHDEIIIGDLMPINMIMENDVKNQESWKKICTYKIKKIYPSHAGTLDEIPPNCLTNKNEHGSIK
jgi:glyoxylase-like metal-dependent hydrolase (beta-lactamase superfamily II)